MGGGGKAHYVNVDWCICVYVILSDVSQFCTRMIYISYCNSFS